MNTIYVAHRGSLINGGVENTKEAFMGGVLSGAKASECDVRVTKDGTFIIFHDPTLERLTLGKHKGDVNQMTYDELKDIELTQTYKEKTYTGKICLYEEYLEICKQANVIPIIELKWTNGIYSDKNDPNNYNYSNLDKIVTYIKQHDLYEVAYVMTSMRGCLDYLRDKYPTLKLQWLCTNNVLEHLDWCIERNISIDVEQTSCTKELVETAHKHGLVVNIWTMNQEERLQKYLDMNVDMITSDWVIK